MAITFTTQIEGDLLLVETMGYDESLDDVIGYAEGVVESCLATNTTRVLCDERQLEYRIGTFDTYQAASFLSEHLARTVRIALVYDERFSSDARFWETVAVNRGVTVRIFKSLDDARHWLDD